MSEERLLSDSASVYLSLIVQRKNTPRSTSRNSAYWGNPIENTLVQVQREVHMKKKRETKLEKYKRLQNEEKRVNLNSMLKSGVISEEYYQKKMALLK